MNGRGPTTRSLAPENSSSLTEQDKSQIIFQTFHVFSSFRHWFLKVVASTQAKIFAKKKDHHPK